MTTTEPALVCARCGHDTTEPLTALHHHCTVVVEAMHDGVRIRATRARLTGRWHVAMWDDATSGYVPCAETAEDAQGALDVARAELDLYASAPEPGPSDTSREAPAPSPRCAPSPGTSDGPRPRAEAP